MNNCLQMVNRFRKDKPVLSALVFSLAMAGMAQAATPATAAKMLEVQPWGSTADGVKVDRVTVQNKNGMRLTYTDYGASLVAVEVPDRNGKLANVIISLPDLPTYLKSKRRFGSVGRYVGRIGGNRYTLDGKEVDLNPPKDAAPAVGYERRIWKRSDFQDANSAGSVFTMESPAGDQQFPGALTVKVTYRLLRNSNEFQIEYNASTDAPTVLNLTNHSYYNLAGAGTPGLSTHRFQINADRYVELKDKLPTGKLPSVAGTPLDFRKATDINERLAKPSELLGDPPGFDHGLVFSKPLGKFDKVAVIEDTASGRRMEVRTTEPSVQLFNGSSFDGSEKGPEGRAWVAGDGFAFETEHLSDSPNHPNFPSTALYPGKPFKALTTFRFSVDKSAKK
ncbi:MAG: aldose epimerase family protein [Massilia sp.]